MRNNNIVIITYDVKDLISKNMKVLFKKLGICVSFKIIWNWNVANIF